MPGPDDSHPDARVAVVGGGPAGLMAAWVVSARGAASVDVYEAMPSVGRKLLVAGRGGLNLTHSEPRERFVARYGAHRDRFDRLLARFSPDDLRRFAAELGVKTMVGSSGRVFPVDLKAAPLLRALVARLRERGVRFHARHRWQGFGATPTELWFRVGADETRRVAADAVVLALGGASWRRLGSDGVWVPALRDAGVEVRPFAPTNCGFEVDWSPHFRERCAGQPLKNLILTVGDRSVPGELMLTDYGVEGGGVYALSAELRDALSREGEATLWLDLKRDLPEEELARRLARPRGRRSVAEHFRRVAGLRGAPFRLLREVVTAAADLEAPARAARWIKRLPLRLRGTRPLDEAISSAGGVAFPAVDENLMLRAVPGVFVAGEMLDWEAPTGGYLLQGAFSSGCVAGEGALRFLGDGA